MRYIIFTILLFSLHSTVLGQELIFSEPKKMESTINSTSEEVSPLLSRDGNTLYFVRTFYEGNIGGELGAQDIWYSQRDQSGVWDTAVSLNQLNNQYNNIILGVGNNDSSIYVQNTYSNPLRWDYGISVSEKKNGKWQPPLELNLKFKRIGSFQGYFVPSNKDVIIESSNKNDSYGNEDLYIYRLEGNKWLGPIHLDTIINTPEGEISPFLCDDYETLFFSSDGHDGYGSFDLFMTKRLDSTWLNWSVPVNLGPVINSTAFDAYFSTYPSGESFYVSSKKEKYADIYSTTLSYEEIPIVTDTIVEDSTAYDTLIVDTLLVEIPIDTIKTEPVEVVEKEDRLPFTIQILAMPRGKKPNKIFFDHLDISHVEKSEGKDHLDRYYIGEFQTLVEALRGMDTLRKVGYSDSFVRKVEKYSTL